MENSTLAKLLVVVCESGMTVNFNSEIGTILHTEHLWVAIGRRETQQQSNFVSTESYIDDWLNEY